METDYLDTPLGILEISASERGIRRISFLDNPSSAVDRTKVVYPHLSEAKEQLSRYFSGESTRFDCLLDLQGTDFQIRVWNQLLQIPFGQSRTYGELAREIGQPNASRAVGMANNRNPIPIIVPCHRVVGASNRLVGFAAGLWRKQWMLEHEGIVLPLGEAKR